MEGSLRDQTRMVSSAEAPQGCIEGSLKRRDIALADVHGLSERAPFAIRDLETTHGRCRPLAWGAVVIRIVAVEITSFEAAHGEHGGGIVGLLTLAGSSIEPGEKVRVQLDALDRVLPGTDGVIEIVLELQ